MKKKSLTTAEKLVNMLDALASIPEAAPADTIESYFVRQSEWSERTFGSGTRTQGIVEHIRKELEEVLANPHDLEEWIDLTMLAMDGFWRHGGDPRTILEHLNAKQRKNFARKWQTPQDGRAVEHVRDEPGRGSGREGEGMRHEIVERFIEAVAALQARIAELEKEATRADHYSRVAQMNGEVLLKVAAVVGLEVPFDIGADTLAEMVASLRTRAEAAEKLAGEAIDCLRTLADRVSRGQNILINPGICLHANALLSSPAAEQAQERALAAGLAKDG